MSSAPPTSTYGAAAAELSVICSWHASSGSMVGSWCPGLGAANAGSLKPVCWGSIVYVKVFFKKKQDRCIKDTADHAAGGSSGRRRRGSGLQGANYRSINHHEGLRIFQQNFEFPWARLFQKAGSTRPPRSHRIPQFYVHRRSDFRLPPFSAAASVADLEPHTGARPSVCLCVGLIYLKLKIHNRLY